ncbi:CYTH and CHAD domain-containing protein [Hamadaea tsunoensis]|uniref:CYTH and CHAD domain-containing protein n=1 Tax=Hamadaea tsunoensis TaxID=53368 RepID=UPI0003FBA59C|nr:CYTH and CHAD domain-containing protein [Hamadaea tsunoensis]
MAEEERKYAVPPAFRLPELRGLRVRAATPRTLTATYYDTGDLRLARSGASLRYRSGDLEPWTVKLPTATTGVREEISLLGPADAPPEDLVWLVASLSRGAPLAPVATLRSVRRAHEVRDGNRVLAEIDDDTVSVLDGRRVARRFREIEVERRDGSRRALDRIEDDLVAAGARTGAFVPKLHRALGDLGPPDLVPPGDVGPHPTAADVVALSVRGAVDRFLRNDPLVRLKQPLDDGDTPVHRMRVACRRLRSDLRTFRRLLDADWGRDLRAELKWFADVLGHARDAEVLRARLHATARADPLADLAVADPGGIAALDAALRDREERALAGVDAAMRAQRYLALVERLTVATGQLPLRELAEDPAEAVLPRLARRPWRDLAAAAPMLRATAPDVFWHEVRILAKKARYAFEAVSPGVPGAGRAAKKIKKVQALLGEHQDAAVAESTWLELSGPAPVTAGRLAERERAAVRGIRAAYPQTWADCGSARLTDWLR